jgi:hypothetical protein
MKTIINYLFLIFPILSFSQTIEINDFSLKNIDGKMVSLSDYLEAKGFVIIFTCNHCPFAKLYPSVVGAFQFLLPPQEPTNPLKSRQCRQPPSKKGLPPWLFVFGFCGLPLLNMVWSF